ncbi:MAG: flagellar hook-basal body complex protein FliE [Buchnera aphidicola (Floraphis choui)]
MFIDTIRDGIEIITALGSLMDINETKDNISKKFTNNISDAALSFFNLGQKEVEQKPEELESDKNKHMTLSDVLISLQKNLISTEAMVQIRNKVISGYQEMMNLQI